MSQRALITIPPNGVRAPSSEWDRQARSLVHRAGLRYVTGHRIAYGTRSNGQAALTTPDMIFRGKGLAVYLDGCYWHGCPDHYPTRTQPLDSAITTGLTCRGWRVLRIWECVGAPAAADSIIRLVKR